MTDPIVYGAPRKVHHNRTPCQSKNRYVVTADWKKVSYYKRIR